MRQSVLTSTPARSNAVLYICPDAAVALVTIMPEGFAVVDPSAPVFELSESQTTHRVRTSAPVAGLDDGLTGHSSYVDMAQDLAAERGAEAKYYQRRGG